VLSAAASRSRALSTARAQCTRKSFCATGGFNTDGTLVTSTTVTNLDSIERPAMSSNGNRRLYVNRIRTLRARPMGPLWRPLEVLSTTGRVSVWRRRVPLVDEYRKGFFWRRLAIPVGCGRQPFWVSTWAGARKPKDRTYVELPTRLMGDQYTRADEYPALRQMVVPPVAGACHAEVVPARTEDTSDRRLSGPRGTRRVESTRHVVRSCELVELGVGQAQCCCDHTGWSEQALLD